MWNATVQPSSSRVAMALLLACCVGACTPDQGTSNATDPVGTSSSGGSTTDGLARQPDTNVSVDECQSDTKCFAKFPEVPVCRRPRCVAGTCQLVVTDDNGVCEDGNLCTVDDYCLAGVCRQGDLKVCTDDNPCTDDACNLDTGACDFSPGNAACTKDGACAVGVCKQGVCDASDKLFDTQLALPANGTATAIVELTDGSFAIGAWVETASTATRTVLLTTDPAGGGVATTALLPISRVHAAAATPEGVLLAGEVTVSGEQMNGVLLHRTKQETLWRRTYGGAADDRLHDVVRLASGAVIACGATASKGSGQHDAWLLRTDKHGASLLDYSYGSADDEVAFAIAAVPAVGYAVVGQQVGKVASDGLIFVVNAEAGLLWLKHVGGAFDDRLDAVTVRADGTLLAAGSVGVSSDGGTKLWLGVFDSNGSQSWSKAIAGHGWARATALVSTPFVTGGAIVAGATSSAFAGAGWRPFAAAIDGIGNVIWTRSSPRNVPAQTVALLARVDGFVGLAEATTTTDEKLWLFRADSFGNTSCAQSGTCATKLNGCNDNNPCTADTCTPTDGCVSAPLPNGAQCGGGGTCKAGVCQ